MLDMPMEAAMGTVTVMILSAGLLVLGFLLGWLVSSKVAQSRIHRAELSAEKIIEDAQKEADSMKRTAVLEAKDEIHQERLIFESELDDKRAQTKEAELKLGSRERQLDRRADLVNHKEKLVTTREEEVDGIQAQLEAQTQELSAKLLEQNQRLERIAGLTKAEAKDILMANLEQEAKSEAEWRVKELRDDAIARANDEAREIIASAIQRLAADHTIESTVAMVRLPTDEMKGRIIGREGRNIRAFEMATGVDVTIDDTPEAVVLSGFDPIRRSIAKMALEQLILDGRIHPGRIEEIVERSTESMQQVIRETGEQTAFDVGVPGLHDRLVECLGRLRYRTSYGQNVLNHSKEVAFIAGMMATSLGLDAQLAKRAGLLHDIGKGLNHEAEGTHGENGADLARKFGEAPIVVNAIEAHHGESDPISPVAVLVDAADIISRSRPGAQREVLENYVRRLERLESIAKMIEGVEAVYAIKAGQEVRVIADCEMMSDADTEKLATQIADRLAEDVTCPGPVKVTVIRETRAVDFAR
jgi:ribonucrease Y